MRYSGSPAGPMAVDVPDRGQKMCFQPDIKPRKSYITIISAFSDSGVPGSVGVGTPAAAAAAGELLSHPATHQFESLQTFHSKQHIDNNRWFTTTLAVPQGHAFYGLPSPLLGTPLHVKR